MFETRAIFAVSREAICMDAKTKKRLLELITECESALDAKGAHEVYDDRHQGAMSDDMRECPNCFVRRNLKRMRRVVNGSPEESGV